MTFLEFFAYPFAFVFLLISIYYAGLITFCLLGLIFSAILRPFEK
jgi:hypothetical protein